MLAAIVERPIDHIQFDPSVLPRVEKFTGEPDKVRSGSAELLLKLFQQLTAALVIDRPPVVGIYQAEVPQFSALVEVWHAWHRKLKESLRQRIVDAKLRNLVPQLLEVLEE